MRYEYSHEQDLPERIVAKPLNKSTLIPPKPASIAPPIPQQQLKSKADPRTAFGCISAASFAFLSIAIWSSLMAATALSAGDGLVLMAYLLKALFAGVIAIGLRRGYRWALRLFFIACVMLLADFISPALILTLEGVNRYMTHSLGKSVFVATTLVLYGGVALIVGLIAWWFWRNRHYFVPHPSVDEWGYRIYLLAIVVSIAIVAADIATTYRSLDEVVETQAPQFRRLDQMMNSFGE